MPGLNLYAPDKRHPGVAGSYLADCVTYASLFKSSPVDLTYTAGLDSAIAKHLQTVAWETVQEYFKPSAFDLLSVPSIHPSHRSTAGGAAFAEAGVVATQGWGGSERAKNLLLPATKTDPAGVPKPNKNKILHTVVFYSSIGKNLLAACQPRRFFSLTCRNP